MRTEGPHLILASASPRRHDLLSRIGLRFVVVPADIDEDRLDNEPPREHVRRLAVEKARAVARHYPGLWVLGADTIVVIDRKILGKPVDRADAEMMLSALSSNMHEVYTGYAILNTAFPSRERSSVVRSEVFIRALTRNEILGYIDTGEPMDKAGAYAIQGVGSAIVERVCGSYTNVVGLPLCEVAKDLDELGIYAFLKGNAPS